MYLPTTREELRQLGWERPDIVLITGDAYVDSPHFGVALIGKHLLSRGFKVAIIAQPDTGSGQDIGRLGEPRLFWGVTGGCIDSMVANYTATKKWRKQDDYTPGGVNRRPDRAVIAYANLIRKYFKNTVPIVLGGLEASLRRIAHYDYWDNSIRRSVLFDAKADILLYGMAEKAALALARSLNDGADWRAIGGLCHIAGEPKDGFRQLPPFETLKEDRRTFFRMFREFYENVDVPSTGFVQRHGDRWLVHNPPQDPVSPRELDAIHALDFERDVHPCYRTGEIRALETIRQSITTHRGCFGQCSFCAITVHQGRHVVSRSADSIVQEVEKITRLPGFNGIIYDVGGPTANMYAAVCARGGTMCRHRSCLMPQVCPRLEPGHRDQAALLKRLRGLPGVKKVFVSSGIRHDMVVADRDYGETYIRELVGHHVSGQIKLAPEHYDNEVLFLMNKPSIKPLMRFKALFEKACRQLDKRYFMTYYLMAAHPGCTMEHMYRLRDFLKGGLGIIPEQVQIFTPTPSTMSTAMYYCEMDASGKNLFCERIPERKQRQKDVLKKPEKMPFFGHKDIPGRKRPGRGPRKSR